MPASVPRRRVARPGSARGKRRAAKSGAPVNRPHDRFCLRRPWLRFRPENVWRCLETYLKTRSCCVQVLRAWERQSAEDAEQVRIF